MITIPHRFSPREYQLPFLAALDRGIKRLVIVWARRSGKDKTVLNAVIKEMLKRVGNYYYFFPTYKQARRVIWDGRDKDGMAFLEHFPKEVVHSINNTTMQVKLINGSIFQLIGTDKIDSIVGSNPIGCVFSEYSIQNPNAWNFIRPILAENGGWAVFNFTPRGKNHGWKVLEQAKQDPSWFWQVLTVDDTGALSAETLQSERSQMPEALFRQEYYCEFLEGAGQFFRGVRNNLYDPINPPPIEGDIKLGVDLAKYQDWTVITPVNLNTFTVYPQDRFNQIDWTTQEGRILSSYLKYKAHRLTIDRSGVGDPVVDALRNQHGITITDQDAFVFTRDNREKLLRHLAILIESGKLKLPNDEGLLSELEAFQLELTENGRVSITVPDGLHDDRVMSLALAVWGYDNPIPRSVPVSNYQRRVSDQNDMIYSDIGV